MSKLLAVLLMAASANAQTVIGLIGDSISTCYNSSPPNCAEIAAPTYLHTAYPGTTFTVVDRAISGTKSTDWASGGSILAPAIAAFVSGGVNTVWIMLGTNDAAIFMQTDAVTYGNNITSIIADLKTAGIHSIVLNYSPANTQANSGLDPASSNPALLSYQTKLQAIAAADPTNVKVGDDQAYAWFLAHPSYSDDGVHPNGPGYIQLGTLWAQGYISHVLGATFTNGYKYCKLVRTQSAMVSGSSDLTNFPLQVSLVDVELKSLAKGGLVTNVNGYDIALYPDCSGSSSPLSWTLSSYVGAAGKFTAWVLRPTLSHTTDDTIGMFFGNSGVSTNQSTGSVGWTTGSSDWNTTGARNQANGKYQDFGPIISPVSSSATVTGTTAVGYSPNTIRLTWTTSAVTNTRGYCGTASGGPYHFYTDVSDLVKSGDNFYGVTAHAISVMVPTTNTSTTAYYCVGTGYDTSGNVVITPEVHAGTLAALTSNVPVLAAVSPSPIYYNCQATGTLGCPNLTRGRDGDTLYCTWAADGAEYCAANDGWMKWNGSFPVGNSQSVGAYKLDSFLGPETMMGNQSGGNSTGLDGAINTPPNYTADGQRAYGETMLSVDGNIYYYFPRCCASPGADVIFKTTDYFGHTIGPQSNTGPSVTGKAFNTSASCGGLGTIVGCWDYPSNLASTSTPIMYSSSWFNSPWWAQFGRDWGGAGDIYIDSTWHHNSGTDSNVYYVDEFGASTGKVDRHNIQITDDQFLYRIYQGDGVSNDGYYPWAWQPIDGTNGTTWAGNVGNTIGGRNKLYWIPEPFNRWIMISQTFAAGSNSDIPSGLLISDVGTTPWTTNNMSVIASISKDVSNSDPNYDQLYPGFAGLSMKTYRNMGNGCAQVVMGGTGSYVGPNAFTTDVTHDRYSPVYWWLTLCTGTKPAPQYVGNGRNQYPPNGIDLLYTFEEPSFSRKWINRAGITKWNSTPIQHAVTSHGLLFGIPQNTNQTFNSPYPEVYPTSYTANLTDFTLIASFRHNANIATGSGETVLDKSTVKVTRSGSSANTCLVTVGAVTSSAFTCAMDGSWFTLIVTVSSTTVTVYGSGNIGSTLPLTPLTTFTATGYTSTGTTAMSVGNAIGGGSTANWRGEIGEIGFYTRALSAPELITLAKANRARFAALLPAVVIP